MRGDSGGKPSGTGSDIWVPTGDTLLLSKHPLPTFTRRPNPSAFSSIPQSSGSWRQSQGHSPAPAFPAPARTLRGQAGMFERTRALQMSAGWVAAFTLHHHCEQKLHLKMKVAPWAMNETSPKSQRGYLIAGQGRLLRCLHDQVGDGETGSCFFFFQLKPVQVSGRGGWPQVSISSMKVESLENLDPALKLKSPA